VPLGKGDFIHEAAILRIVIICLLAYVSVMHYVRPF
jgi:hypothetical protein